MTLLIFIIFGAIVLGFVIFSIIIFYHIGRYSYLGDYSKRAFSYYSLASFAIIVLSLIALILNHIIS